MKHLTSLLLLAALAGAAIGADRPPLVFRDVEYLHRWSKDSMHEYTPAGQADLDRWSDMLTTIDHPEITGGEGLAAHANALLGTYKRNRAVVVRTDSTPRTAEKPAGHLLVVLLPHPDFIEAVFVRLKLPGGRGMVTIYSHREYGKKIGDQMSAWLKANGPATEKALMAWAGMPPSRAARSRPVRPAFHT